MAALPYSLNPSRSSSAVSVQPLRHTTNRPPSALQRAYSRNIMNLEQMAEDMSQGGGDIGEEIRRMNEEQKQRSRQSSIQSSHQGDVHGVRGGVGGALGVEHGQRVDEVGGRSRTSSNGLVDVSGNGAARWGGHSPHRVGHSSNSSARSGSGWSHASMPRKPSATGSSRLAQMIEPMQEGKPLDWPLGHSGGSMYSASPPEHKPSRQPSQSSFSKQYDQIASQIEESLEHVPPSPPKHGGPVFEQEQELSRPVTPPLRPRSTDTYQEAQVAFKDFDGVHFSPDTEEFVELDQDGNEVRRVSARSSSGGLSVSGASLLRTPRVRPISYAEPPPAEGMVYYPAPVPRMLNLPKRLSQLPAANVQAKRRTQILSHVPPEAMKAAPWLPPVDLGDAGSRSPGHSRESSGSQSGQHGQAGQPPRGLPNERISMANMQNLPPQLRARVFFNHQSVQHDVEIKNESAVATLDSILAASATAPVSAFTDHPFAGDVRRSAFAPEHVRARRSTATLALPMPAEPETVRKAKKRRSSIGNLLRRTSSGNDLAEQLDRRGSRNSLLLDFNEGDKKLQKRRSQMSLGDEVQRQADPVRAPGNEISERDLSGGLIAAAQNATRDELDEEDEQRHASGSRPPTAGSWQKLDGTQQIEDDFKEEEAQEDFEESDPVFVQPSTLLAELQVRKANQRNRNRTAATHYPHGMHSTLLELDAVEQINKDKRKKQRVPLAWEGGVESRIRQEERGDEDDEVPLGVLYPGKDGLVGGKKKVGDGRDWERPLGLMEKREMEDSEPLASRRNRMLGLPAGFGRAERELGTVQGFAPVGGRAVNLAGHRADVPLEGGEEGEEEEEGETLADRLRKLKVKDALATAVSDVLPKDGSRPVSTFTDDVLSQFGPLDAAEKKAAGASRPRTKGKDAANLTSTDKPADTSPGASQEVEETLGQRRARLQRERETEEDQPLAPLVRPGGPLRSSSSFANLLASNPVSSRKASKDHKPAHGTLLHASALQQVKQKREITSTNVRSASFHGLEKPLVDAGRPQNAREAGMGRLLGAQAGGGAHVGGFAGGMYNNGLGGVRVGGMQTSISTPASFGVGGQGGYFASPTAGAGMMGYGGYGMQQPQPMMASPITYRPVGMPGGSMTSYGFPAMAVSGYGGAAQMPYGAGMGTRMGMGPNMGLAMEDPMDAKKRAGIDQWRASVLQ